MQMRKRLKRGDNIFSDVETSINSTRATILTKTATTTV